MDYVPCTNQQHAAAILEILNDAIVHTTALYDYSPRTLADMNSWFDAKASAGFPVIGAVGREGRLQGFATYGIFRNWPAYKYTVEHSVYIHRGYRGRGTALGLMQRLIAAALQQQLHVMIGAIDVANTASIALHEKLGFAWAGTIKEVAFKFGGWLDLAFYQRILETPRQPVDG